MILNYNVLGPPNPPYRPGLGTMGPRSVIAALGVPLRVGLLRRPSGPRAGKAFHRRYSVCIPPTYDAWIEPDDTDQFTVVLDLDRGGEEDAWANAIHEALHLMLGVDTLSEESAMMVVEWMVCQELAEPWYSAWRELFADYGFNWEAAGRFSSEIGFSDVFLGSREWQLLARDALRNGYLDGCGRVVWGSGIHPSYSSTRFTADTDRHVLWPAFSARGRYAGRCGKGDKR